MKVEADGLWLRETIVLQTQPIRTRLSEGGSGFVVRYTEHHGYVMAHHYI